jgi:GNAT superfamily N-acetyltransferase
MIRKAKKSDINDLVDLIILFEEAIEEIYQGDFSGLDIDEDAIKKTLIQGFDHEFHTILVAEEDGKLFGFGDMWMYPEFGHYGLSAYLHNFFVKKEYKKKGYGKQILGKLIEIAKSKKANAFHITTSFKNKVAISLYKKMGIDSEGLMLETVFKYD